MHHTERIKFKIDRLKSRLKDLIQLRRDCLNEYNYGSRDYSYHLGCYCFDFEHPSEILPEMRRVYKKIRWLCNLLRPKNSLFNLAHVPEIELIDLKTGEQISDLVTVGFGVENGIKIKLIDRALPDGVVFSGFEPNISYEIQPYNIKTSKKIWVWRRQVEPYNGHTTFSGKQNRLRINNYCKRAYKFEIKIRYSFLGGVWEGRFTVETKEEKEIVSGLQILSRKII